MPTREEPWNKIVSTRRRVGALNSPQVSRSLKVLRRWSPKANPSYSLDSERFHAPLRIRRPDAQLLPGSLWITPPCAVASRLRMPAALAVLTSVLGRLIRAVTFGSR